MSLRFVVVVAVAAASNTIMLWEEEESLCHCDQLLQQLLAGRIW